MGEPKEAGHLIVIGAPETPLPPPPKRDSLLVEALLWFVWFPASVMLLVFILERFILSEASF